MEHATGATKFDPIYVHVSLKEPVMVFPDSPAVIKVPPAKISLSPLDRQTPFYMYVLLFYKNNVRRENETVFEELKNALQQVLVPYFPLSGRLRKDDDTGCVGIECSNEGVLLVEASIEDELDLLRDFKLFTSKFEDKFLYKLEPKPANPLLAVQITRFSSGEFVLGIGWRHEVHDGFGISCFLKACADVACGKPLSSIPQPYHGRELLQPKPGLRSSSDWQPKVQEEYQSIPIHIFSQEKQARDWAVTDTATFSSSPFYITKIFPITKPMISSLKKKAMEGGFLTSCSTFDVVTAHAWLARVKAFEMQPNERALLSFAVNGRSRTDPALPEYYAGNAFVMASSNCSVKDALSSPFHAMVERIQKAKRMVGERYIAEVLLFNDDEGIKALTSYRETTMVTDWTKFGLEQLDFGWGETGFVTPAALPLLDVIYAVRTGLEEGGVSLRLGLLPNVMARFEQHLLHI